MTSYMKAAVLEGISKMAVKEVEKPEVDEGSILLRVKACSTCGSDLKIYKHGNSRVSYPAILGHEISGIVEEVGKNVAGYNPGDRLAIGADVPCGECNYCTDDKGNLCPINYAIGYQFPGGFAEYCLLNPTAVKHGPISEIHDHVSYDDAALAEPLGCVLNGFELSQVSPGKTLLIVGAGPMGCLTTIAGKAMGVEKIILSEINEYRLENAKKFGANFYVNPSQDDLVGYVKDITGGKGADVVIVATPSPDAQETAIKAVAKRGYVNLFSGLPKGSRPISIDSNLLHYNESFIFGSHGAVPRHHKMAVEMISSGRILINDLITHRYSLDEIDLAFKQIDNKECLKIVINP